MQLRRGREFYGKKYNEAIALFEQGKSINEVAEILGISYSAAYHWIRGLRKPSAGNVNEFLDYLRSNGPSASVHVMKKFPKHNELFLMASRRGLEVKRIFLGKRYKDLGTWYFLPGQEKELDKRIEDLRKKIEHFKNSIRSQGII